MTLAQSQLLRAAQDALYYFTIGDQFNEAKCCEKFLEMHKKLSEAIMALKYEGMTETDIEVSRAMRRSIRRKNRERRESMGRGLGNPEAYDPCTGAWGAEGPFLLEQEIYASDRGGRV